MTVATEVKKKRGRPKGSTNKSKVSVGLEATTDNVTTNVKMTVPEPKFVPLESKIKYIVRTVDIKGLGIAKGADPVEAVEFVLNTYLNDGWSIEMIAPIRTVFHEDGNTPIGQEILHVLTRE